MMTPFVLSMAMQEKATQGKYTEYHWRKEFRKYLKTKNGKSWYKQIELEENKIYVNQLLKEI